MRLAPLLLASMLYGQTVTGLGEVLDGAREKIRATLQRLPKYTCLQTIHRTYYAPPDKRSGAASCDQMSADKKHARKPLHIDFTDRVRIEVAQGADREIHSWPGASRFDLTEIDQMVDSGPFGTGAFGAYLVGIFDNDAVRFDYRGRQTRDNQTVMVFGYMVAADVSSYDVRAGDSWVTTGYGGTFEVDPESLDVLRVTLQTTELPEETGLCEATSTLDYQRVEIGSGAFLLPRQSQLRMILRDGEETNNSVVFSGCREFHAESKLRFDNPIGPETSVTVPGKPRSALPSRLGVDLKLVAPIDTDTAAAGDEFSATMVHALHPYRSNDVLIPAGAVVHGRISRVEHHLAPIEYWLIGFAFESVEFDGESSPFSARTELPGHYSGTVPVQALVDLLRRVPPPPSDSLIFPNEKRHLMPAGTVTHWITWPPTTGAAK